MVAVRIHPGRHDVDHRGAEIAPDCVEIFPTGPSERRIGEDAQVIVDRERIGSPFGPPIIEVETGLPGRTYGRHPPSLPEPGGAWSRHGEIEHRTQVVVRIIGLEVPGSGALPFGIVRHTRRRSM